MNYKAMAIKVVLVMVGLAVGKQLSVMLNRAGLNVFV